MTAICPTYLKFITSSKELQHSTNKVVRRLKHLNEQPIDFAYASPNLVYLKNSIRQETELVIQGLNQTVQTTNLVQNLRTASLLKKRLQKLISACALLEMKNISLKLISQQLKQELVKLNHLQTCWHNSSCLKN